jgi:glutamine synthetase
MTLESTGLPVEYSHNKEGPGQQEIDLRYADARGKAPACISWGHNNRSVLVLAPVYKPHKGNAPHVEVRSIDAACNPNRAYALILAAGLKGIEEHFDLPPPVGDVSYIARREMNHGKMGESWNSRYWER